MFNWINNIGRRRRVRKLLTELGNSSQEIADALLRLKISGSPFASNICPLAKFLQSQGIQAVVSNSYIYFPPKFSMDLPPACTQFVVDFDMGKYPSLQEKGKNT